MKIGIMASQISGHLVDNNHYVALAMAGGTDSLSVYIWTNGSGWGSKYANPSGTQTRNSVALKSDKK